MSPNITIESLFLVMSLDRLSEAYRAFHDAMPDVAVHYAVKCNPAEGVLRHLHNIGSSFEIATRAELENLVALGVDPSTVLFSNPVKRPSDIVAAAAAGVWRFAYDSMAELDKIATYAPGSGVYLRLATRSTGVVHSEGKFGVDVDAGHKLLLAAQEMGLDPYGLVFHVGSQTLKPESWVAAIDECGRLMRRLESADIRLKMLDIGGGFPAHYGGNIPELPVIAAAIRTAVDRLPYPVSLAAEPRRVLVAEAGVLVAHVIGTADRLGAHWLHLDVGAFNGMMECLETSNQLQYPVSDSRQEREQHLYNVTGPTCDSQDTLFFNVPLSAGLRMGDRMFIRSAGAYTISYASEFNGFDIPDIHYAMN